LSAQAGYGDAKTAGQLSVSKRIGWCEQARRKTRLFSSDKSAPGLPK
jgi:hypothetical protein